MKLYQLVLKDIMRRKKRVLYSALGVMVGTMTVVGILTIALAGQARIYSQLEKYGPNLSVIPAVSSVNTGLGDLSMGVVTVGDNYINEDKLPIIRQITDGEIRKALKTTDQGNIATLAPKLFVRTQINGTPLIVVGIVPNDERTIKTWWVIQEGGTYPQESKQVLAGAIAARELDLKAGSTVNVNGAELTVSGILDETGANEDYQLFMSLGTAQTLFDKKGLISSIDIRALCNACPVEVIADAINKEISGVRAVAVKQVALTEMGMLEKVNKFMLALAGITLLVGLFGVVNTMVASVNERLKDIGIMRAVGASRNQIIKMFIFEAVIIGIIGGIFGYIAGTGLAYVVGPVLFEGAAVGFAPQYFPLSLGLATVIAIIAILYPAFRATRVRVADSFRSL